MRLPWPHNPDWFVLLDNFSIEVLLLGFFGLVTTSRWYLCRVCGSSQEKLYRWLAFWPLVMFLPWFSILIPSPSGHTGLFAHGIAAAFGLAFSIANLRTPSRYSRGLGMVFSILHSFWLYTLFKQCQEYARLQTP
jgi:hypothetical protein